MLQINESLLQESLSGVEQILENDIATECRYSLFTFVKEFWSLIIEEEPVWNWHIPYICNQLEKIFYSVIMKKKRKHDIIINIPPGTSKSTIVTVMFPTWCWIARLPKYKFKNYYKRLARKKGKTVEEIQGRYFRFITGSYAEKLSIEHSEYALNIIQSDKFLKYFPEVQIKKNKAAKSNFVNQNKGQRFTTSVGATVTGVHAHIIVIDDPVDPNKSISEKERITANHWCDQTLSTRKVDKRITVTIMIMQRLHMDDPTGHMIDSRGMKKIRHIVLPATTEYEVKPPELKDYYVDGLLDPVRMDKDVLEDQYITLGSYGYAGQFGQNPVPKEGAMFQEEWFEVIDAPPVKPDKRARGWDLAATSEAEATMKSIDPAFTASVLMSRKGNTFYIEDVYRKRIDSGDLRIVMKNLASQDGKETIIDIPQDPGQAGKDQIKDLVANLAGYIVEFSPESGDKALRLDPLSSQCKAGNVKLVKGPWNKTWLNEITMVPNGKYWDQADSTARAFNHLHIPKGKEAGVW